MSDSGTPESDPAVSSRYRSVLRLGLRGNGRRGMGGAEPLSGASCGREQQDVMGGLRGAVEALEEEEVVGGMFGFAYTDGDSTPSTLRGADAPCGDLATDAIPGIAGPASGARERSPPQCGRAGRRPGCELYLRRRERQAGK
jgi:hypothetical protein